MGQRLHTISGLSRSFFSHFGQAWHRSRRTENGMENGDFNHAKFLQENTARYFAILDTAVDAIIVVDGHGELEAFNHAAERIFGYSAEEVIGQNIRMLMPETEQSAHDSYLQAYRETGVKKIIGIGREVRGRRKDGSIVALELSIGEWRDIDGRQCFTGIMRDVTQRNLQANELKEARDAAERARIEAESANRAKTEFVAVMSHEIRTPLTSISGFIDLLSRTGKLTAQQRRYIELVRTANAALSTIVDDILDFSKVEAGLIELRCKPFAPKLLIADIVAVVLPLAQTKDIAVHYDVASDVAEWLVGDHSRLRQILLNLLNNAIKFTATGSISIHVRRDDKGDRQKIRFLVSDTGVGIALEHQHRLFKQFSQADSSISCSHGGTGLGLAICKRLVELMDGEIGVVSDAGKGTTLWFTAELPTAAPPQTDSVTDMPEPRCGAGLVKILLVDDLDTNREIVKAYLEDEGYAVAAVGNAPDAIGILQKNHFDIVLMDIQMPVMDGVTATNCIRALAKPLSDIPIIAMTGNVLPVHVQTFLASGMNDHVAKPIERAKLYSAVQRWLPSERSDRDGCSDMPREPLFNQTRFNEAVWALGIPRVQSIVERFLIQLDNSFDSDAKASAREAHDLINPAGILGFDSLVALCQAIPETGTYPSASQSMALSALKSEVKTAVAAQLMPQMRSLTLGTMH